MKLMITGGAGFIGSAVARLAVTKGLEVLVVDALTYAANLANLDSISEAKNYSFSKTDIGDLKSMTALISTFKPDAIMHLAAESHVDRSIDGPETFIQTNIVGTFRLIEAARHYTASGEAPDTFRFHHISTDEVFGSLGASGTFTETSRYLPNSPYAASKAASDMLVRAWGETYGMNVIISNCSNNYGPFQFPEKLLPVVITSALEGQPIPVYGKGENVRDWLYVEDHAEALLLIAQEGTIGETYNVGGNSERSNIELVKQVCVEFDKRYPDRSWGKHEKLIEFVRDRPGHDLRYAVDCSKIKRELGWEPKTSLAQGLSKTIDWYLTNQDWLDAIKSRDGNRQRLGLSQHVKA